MPEYKVDVGNSYPGHIGYVAYTEAPNKRKALALFKRDIPSEQELLTIGDTRVIIYLNANALKLSDVRRADE